MQVIPVIDIKDQRVVHAQHGNRAQYQPMHSKLCPSANIDKVIEAYLRLFPFTVFYLADLNAIAGKHDNQKLIAQTLQNYPHLTFWIDSGYQEAPGLYHTYANYLPVLGSESYKADNYQQLANFAQQYILSLDFAAEVKLGADELFQPSELWPDQVIIINLRKVGSAAGPDLDKLLHYRKSQPHRQLIAAGGVRNLNDLTLLKQHDIHAALVASALHNGNISAIELDALSKVQAISV